LVGLRGGDFVKLHSGHYKAFSSDCAEAFDDTAQSPLAVFVGSVGGEEALQSLVGMPLEVIGSYHLYQRTGRDKIILVKQMSEQTTFQAQEA